MSLPADQGRGLCAGIGIKVYVTCVIAREPPAPVYRKGLDLGIVDIEDIMYLSCRH